MAASRRRREPARWAPYDGVMTAAARERIEVLPVLIGIPGGRVRLNRPRTRPRAEGRGPASSAESPHATVAAGRSGRLTRSSNRTRSRPIRCGTSPTCPPTGVRAHDAAGYVRLVRLTRARLRAVDPQARIVLAGLPDSTARHAAARLRARHLRPARRPQPVRRRRAEPILRRSRRGVLEKLNWVRAYMDRRGDRRTPIWVTEIGWATGGPRSPFTHHASAGRRRRSAGRSGRCSPPAVVCGSSASSSSAFRTGPTCEREAVVGTARGALRHGRSVRSRPGARSSASRAANRAGACAASMATTGSALGEPATG